MIDGKPTKMNNVLGCKPTHNPNISDGVKFEKVVLQMCPLLWPYLVIEISDDVSKGQIFGALNKKGCESSFTTVSLIDYADEDIFFDVRGYKYAKHQMMRNQDNLERV